MGVPLHWLVGGGIALALLGGLVKFVYDWLAQPNQEGSNIGMKNSSNNNSNSMNSGGKMTLEALDAFQDKEWKKDRLYERARKRYLKLHPEFTPPMKGGKEH